MKLILCAMAVSIAGCQSKTSLATDEAARPGEESWSSEERSLMRCLEERKLSECVEMGSPQRMSGVWYTGFEESGFVPDVASVPLERERDGPSPGSDTDIEIDANAAMRQLNLPAIDRCIRAVQIEFIGRRAVNSEPHAFGVASNMVAVDRLLSGRLIGRVRTRGLAGYDEQCATPAPSAGEVEKLDKAEWDRCRAAGQCISAAELEARRNKKN